MCRTQTVLHASLAIYSAAIEVMAKVYLIPVHVDGVASLRVSQVSPCTPWKPQQGPSPSRLNFTMSDLFTGFYFNMPLSPKLE